MASVAPIIHNDESDVLTKIGEELFLSEELADFHFIFEVDDGLYERVPAHKIFLITASNVFRAMFNGTWVENKEVEIVDASVVEFKEFLQFFYLKQVKVSMDNVDRVLYLGHKYNIAKCMSVCEKFIINTVDETSVCTVYGLAILYDQINLKKYCEAFIGINTKAVLSSENFLECDLKMLDYILNLDSLSCSENELFEACMNWIKATAKVDQLTREIVHNQLGELFYTIRFKSMTPQEFAKLVPSYGSILSADEYGDISQAVAVEEYQPNLFSKKPRLSFDNLVFDKMVDVVCNLRVCRDYSAKPYYIKNIEKTKFSINTPLFLVDVYFAKILKYNLNTYFAADEDMQTEMTIIQTPKSVKSGEKIILYNGKHTLRAENFTDVKLSKPLFIRPGFLYEIQLVQSPCEDYSTGLMLKTEVKMESNITAQFYKSYIDPAYPINRGLIQMLKFKKIINEFSNRIQSSEENKNRWSE